MNIMTIPKKITNKGELVIIPRFEYEALLKSQQKNKSNNPFSPPPPPVCKVPALVRVHVGLENHE